MERIVDTVDPQKREHHKSLEGLYQWRYHCCYRKSCESHQVLKNSCWRKLCQMLCMASQDLWQRQSKKSWKRVWLCQKKIVGGDNKFQNMDFGEIQELINIPEEINRRWLDGDKCFQTVPNNEEEDKVVVSENKFDTGQSGRRALIIQDYFGLLL